jgi:protoporphyrinogen oxidase
MAKFCSQRGAEIYKNSEVSRVYLQQNRVGAVEINTPNSKFKVECSDLIFSIPIPDLVRNIHPQPKEEVIKAADNLIYRNLILVFMTADLDNATNQIMVYLLDKDFTFNRIGEQKNIDITMVPKGKTLLCLEICSAEDDWLWNSSDQALFSLARQDLAKLNKIPAQALSNFSVRRIRQAYPIYDLNFDQNLRSAIDYISGLENILPIGRQGIYINNDIHDSMQMGLEVARHIREGRPKEDWNKQVKAYLDWRLR